MNERIVKVAAIEMFLDIHRTCTLFLIENIKIKNSILKRTEIQGILFTLGIVKSVKRTFIQDGMCLDSVENIFKTILHTLVKK